MVCVIDEWLHMITSSNGNIFRVTDHLCGEFPGDFPAQRTVTQSFEVFFFICARISGWASNREAGDLRRYHAHHDVIVMILQVLLYPIIIMATLGFASDKMYTKPANALAWTQVILLTIDVLDLLWTQSVRLYMIYQLFADLKDTMKSDEDEESKKSCCSSADAGGLLMRGYVTIVGNAVLFLLQVVLMGAQMNAENLQTSKHYYMGYRSGMQAFCLIVLPLYSMFMFVVANSYWVMELLIMLNLKVGTSPDFQKKYDSDVVVSDAVGFCMARAETTKDRLADIQSLSKSKKVLYGLSDARIIVLLLIWVALVCMVLFTFDAFENPIYDSLALGSFAVVAAVSNYQLVALVVTMVVTTPVLAVGMAVYPVSMMICFWKKPTIDPEDDVEVVTLGAKDKEL